MVEPTKPNLAFLRKVADRQVYAWFSYSAKKGGHYGFTGGETTFEKHRKAGFVKKPGPPELGRPSYVELTDAGRAALSPTP